jgi:hypothetical protein
VSARLAQAPFAAYLKDMYLLRQILPLLLALALLGAPFGMGRMMDQAHAHQTMHAAHGMQHGTEPPHKSSAPHYMLCAACVAASAPDTSAFDPIMLTTAIDSAEPAALNGMPALPPVPPPKPTFLIA